MYCSNCHKKITTDDKIISIRYNAHGGVYIGDIRYFYDQSSRKPTNFSRGMNALFLLTERLYIKSANILIILCTGR